MRYIHDALISLFNIAGIFASLHLYFDKSCKYKSQSHYQSEERCIRGGGEGEGRRDKRGYHEESERSLMEFVLELDSPPPHTRYRRRYINVELLPGFVNNRRSRRMQDSFHYEHAQ